MSPEVSLECDGNNSSVTCEWCIWTRWEVDPKGAPTEWTAAPGGTNWTTLEDDDCEEDGDTTTIVFKTAANNPSLSNVNTTLNNYQYHIVIGRGQCPDPDDMWSDYDKDGVLPMGAHYMIEF
jgi:hypothetical protein